MNKTTFKNFLESKEEKEILNDFEILEDGTIVVDTRKVTQLRIESILSYKPKRVIFTSKVQVFDSLAFKNADCLPFDFSTATGLKEIKSKCFKDAYNVIWATTLDDAKSSPSAFENIKIIARYENLSNLHK